jgi:hypothetical protein
MLGWRVASEKQGDRARTSLQGNGNYANKLLFQGGGRTVKVDGDNFFWVENLVGPPGLEPEPKKKRGNQRS